MIQAISSSNKAKTTGYSNNLRNGKATQVSFTGFNPTSLKKGIIERGSSDLSGKTGRFLEEAKESLGRVWSKLTGENTIPVTKKPLTANGEIIHPSPDGVGTIKIDVPDKDIPKNLDGNVDGQGNIYHRTGDGTVPAEADKSANVWDKADAEAKTQQNDGHHANIWDQSEAEAASDNHAQGALSHEVSDETSVSHTSVSGDDVAPATPEEPRHKGFWESLFGGDDVHHTDGSAADTVDDVDGFDGI